MHTSKHMPCKLLPNHTNWSYPKLWHLKIAALPGITTCLTQLSSDKTQLSTLNLHHALAVMSSPIPQALWSAQIPLRITHPASPTTPFITSIPRFSYLALLVPRLSTFFNSPCSSFHFEDVQLRNLAVGLLVDLYQPSLPWRLTVNDGVGWDIADTFLNCVKEVSRNKCLNIRAMDFLDPYQRLDVLFTTSWLS